MMRAILVSACLLLTALAVVPTASADDMQCRTFQNSVTTCHSLGDVTDDHSCVIVGVGNPQSGIGGCVREGDGYLCAVYGGGTQFCVLQA